jgi:predicted DNA-binding protein
MTKVLTLRLDPELLGKAEARAARLGLDRAKYVRSLIEEDLAGEPAAALRKFASEDLAGMYEGPGTAATNDSVRKRLRQSSAGQRV